MSHLSQILNTVIIIIFGIGSLVLLFLYLRGIAKYKKLKKHNDIVEQAELDQRLHWIGK